jgi:hypothetical protein
MARQDRSQSPSTQGEYGPSSNRQLQSEQSPLPSKEIISKSFRSGISNTYNESFVMILNNLCDTARVRIGRNVLAQRPLIDSGLRGIQVGLVQCRGNKGFKYKPSTKISPIKERLGRVQ